MEVLDLVKAISQVLHDKKAFNLLALDVRGISSITDFLIIAEGNVERHVKALAAAVHDELTRLEWPIGRVEGLEQGDWVVIDCWQIMIHLFIPELRQRYQLERLWEGGKLVDLRLEDPVERGLSR